MGFFDAFTGKAQKKAIEEANRQATGYLGTGYNEAKGALTLGYDEAGRYNQEYRNALGLNGSAGSATAMAAYNSARNPYARQQEDSTTNALMRQYNARGMSMGGNATLAAARAVSEQGYQDYNNWLTRLQGSGDRSSQLAVQRGQNMADLGWGYNNALAGNAVNYGNAKASAEGIGWNNIFNVAGTAAKAFAGFK